MKIIYYLYDLIESSVYSLGYQALSLKYLVSCNLHSCKYVGEMSGVLLAVYNAHVE